MTLTQPRTGRLPLEELCALPTIYHPLLSWRRDRVAFYWDRTGRLELHVLDLASGAVRQVSHGETPRALRSFFVWTRDDRGLVFARDRDGDENHDLFRLDLESGAVTRLTEEARVEKHAIELSPDDEWLTVNANRRMPESPERPGQMNLWLLRADGGEWRPLTRYAAPTYGGHWSPDGAWLAFTTNEGAPGRNRDGYVTRPDGTGVRKVLSLAEGSQDLLGAWHPDGGRLSVTSDASGLPRAGVLDIDTGEVRWLGDGEAEEHALRFSPSGERLLALRNVDARDEAVVYDLAHGAGTVLAIPEGVVAAADFIDDRTVLVQYATPRERTTLARYDLGTGRLETLVAPDYGSVDPAAFVDVRHIRYRSADGTSIPALLAVPREIAPGARLPAVVYVHGGPTGQWQRGFDPYVQFLVDRGFVVLQPNPRGSTGYGVAFRDACLRDWGGKDLEDVAAGASYLASLSYVDGDRLVVHGGSYGGFMTFIAATKRPELWRAAVANVGVTDLHRMWEESKEHFRYFLRVQMGDPEADRALWRDRSAVEFAHQLRAKLLMVHGVNDPRCPVSQSRLFRDRLLALGKREGVDFDYIEWDDQGHGSVDIAARTARFRRIVDWLERAIA